MKPLRKNIYISLIVSSLFFIYFQTNDFQNQVKKTYKLENLTDDTSTIQRLSFYKKAL